jgi:hypothetical protein
VQTSSQGIIATPAYHDPEFTLKVSEFAVFFEGVEAYFDLPCYCNRADMIFLSAVQGLCCRDCGLHIALSRSGDCHLDDSHFLLKATLRVMKKLLLVLINETNIHFLTWKESIDVAMNAVVSIRLSN